MSDQPLKVAVDDERDRAVYEAQFIPGWIGEGGLRPEPLQDCVPFRWRWQTGRKLLQEAAGYIDPSKSERRNIRMANPAPGRRTSLNTIHGSYQMAAPDEFARAHRHTINAGRFVLESDGAYTTLDGEKVYMGVNDIILTPNWVWHGLGNESQDRPAFWVDFLDDPLVDMMQAVFFEVRDEIETVLPEQRNSPLHLRWSTVEGMLDAAKPLPDAPGNRRLQLDARAIPTLGLFMQRIDAGTGTVPLKSTANRLFIAVEGTGTTDIAGQSFAWERGDVVAVPSWQLFQHSAATDATLLEITDQPVIEALHWYREMSQ